MKSKYSVWLRFELVLVAIIIVAFVLPWISWGKLVYSGFDIPFMYKKTTNISNTLMFFLKKESPHLAFYIYLVPILGLLSAFFVLKMKYRFANVLLSLCCFLGFCLSLYMYYYLWSSKLFKLSHAGIGLHLLCVVTLIGCFYSMKLMLRRKRKVEADFFDKEIQPNLENPTIS